MQLKDIRSDIEQHTYGIPTIAGNYYRRGFYNGLVLSKYIY